MLGAIAGDIAGSPWENGKCPRGAFQLFPEDSVFTDDTVCTIGIADGLLASVPPAARLRAWVRRYPGRGYGGWFVDWAHDDSRGPYGSFGNGGAMRVAAVGWLANSLEEAQALAARTAALTHDHPEGVKGAVAIATAIWLARHGMSPVELLLVLPELTGYSLKATTPQLERGDGVSTHAQDSVPAALVVALEAGSWYAAMCNAAAVGGDTDTLCCMAGGVAEALYGLPSPVARGAMAYLPPEMQQVVAQVYARAQAQAPWEQRCESRLRRWLRRLAGR